MRLLVNIDVPEIEPAIAFYRAALGLESSRMVSSDVAELTGASTAIYLLRNEAGSVTSFAGSRQRDCARHWTLVHLDFVVDDVAVAAERALMAGTKQEGECVCWNGSKCITFADPFGHGFCLIEFEEGTYDGGVA
ncbi:MAG: VOC family protein [Burkholderiales bacterium]